MINECRENMCRHRQYRSHSSIAKLSSRIVNAIAFRAQYIYICVYIYIYISRGDIRHTWDRHVLRSIYAISLLFSFSSPRSIPLSQRDNRVSPKEISFTDNRVALCHASIYFTWTIFLRFIRHLHRIKRPGTSFGERSIFSKGAEWYDALRPRTYTSLTIDYFPTILYALSLLLLASYTGWIITQCIRFRGKAGSFSLVKYDDSFELDAATTRENILNLKLATSKATVNHDFAM